MKKTRPKIHQPHDKIARITLGDLPRARKILREILPQDIAPLLEFNRLAKVPGHFVDNKLREFVSDFLFSVPIKGRNVLLFVLVEHKSYLDRWARFWLLLYMVRIWEQWLRDHPKAKKLPPILPLVLYHGDTDWNFPCEFSELIDVPEELRGVLGRFLVRFEHALFDVHRLPMDKLGRDAITRIFLGTLKAGREDQAEEWLKTVLPCFDELSPAEQTTLKWLQALFLYATETNAEMARIPPSTIEEEVCKLSPGSVRKSLMTLKDIIREGGRQEGRQEGIEEGLQRGLLLGRVQTYQKMLGVPVLSETQAEKKTVAALEKLLEGLESKFSQKFQPLPARQKRAR